MNRCAPAGIREDAVAIAKCGTLWLYEVRMNSAVRFPCGILSRLKGRACGCAEPLTPGFFIEYTLLLRNIVWDANCVIASRPRRRLSRGQTNRTRRRQEPGKDIDRGKDDWAAIIRRQAGGDIPIRRFCRDEDCHRQRSFAGASGYRCIGRKPAQRTSANAANAHEPVRSFVFEAYHDHEEWICREDRSRLPRR